MAGGNDRFGDAIASALGWWVDAGVDTAIAETPRNWLAPPARAGVPVPAALAAAPVAVEPAAALPGDLAAFQAFLAEQEYLP
ncbi:MAG TPA: uracil-DNA glycosylase, partial [Sphingomonas sp.]